jgi:hypothetical protein
MSYRVDLARIIASAVVCGVTLAGTNVRGQNLFNIQPPPGLTGIRGGDLIQPLAAPRPDVSVRIPGVPSFRLPRTQRLLSDRTQRTALSRGFQRALCAGGLPREAVNQIVASAKRTVAPALAGQANGSLPTTRELQQIYCMSGLQAAVGKAVGRGGRYRNDPVIRKLSAKLAEMKTWPAARRRALATSLGARFMADPGLRRAWEGIKNGQVPAAEQLQRLGGRALDVARQCLVRDLGLSPAEVRRLDDVARDVAAPVKETVQLFAAPKNLLQRAKRAALATNMNARGVDIQRARDQIAAVGGQVLGQAGRELPAVARTLRGRQLRLDLAGFQGALLGDPAWGGLKTAVTTDLAAVRRTP